MIAETVGVTQLEPLLAALPPCFQRLRFGPLASPGQYTARDWQITNVLCFSITFLFYTLNYKYVGVCGWSPNEFPWNLAGYPEPNRSCNDEPVTVFEAMFSGEPSAATLFSFSGLVVFAILIFVGTWCMARKLPRWGEPAASDAKASDTAKASPVVAI